MGNIFEDFFGTGDAFIAGFAYADVLGYTEKTSGELGSALAYLKIKEAGKSPWYRNPTKIKNIWRIIKQGYYHTLDNEI